jgi:hypothetical protein
MKVLLFITGYRQVKEYDYFNRFLQRLDALRDLCDVFIYCNNVMISADIITYYQKFTQANKHLYITSRNVGFGMGGVEAVSRGLEMSLFDGYDYVINLHPDVFIVDESGIVDLLHANLDNDCVFLVNKSLPDDDRFFSFDFFIFKPKLLKRNIFIDELYAYDDVPEHYLCDMLVKHEVKFKVIKRFANDTWFPRRVDEHLGLYHEHELERVEALLNPLPETDHVRASVAVTWPPPAVALRPFPKVGR